MTELEEYFYNNIRSDSLFKSFEKAVCFYGDFMKKFLIENECDFAINCKKNRNHLGQFCSQPLQISVHKVKEQLGDEILDCVIVHELAHFLDHLRAPKYSRYRWASTSRSSKERSIITLFRSKMVPFPEKRTNYRGRTCEIFARSIEEYYAIKTNNTNWIKDFGVCDRYVSISVFKQIIYPAVEDYLRSLK